MILGWQWSASPGVVRFHPGLSPLLIVSLPPPTRVGTCLLFQVSSFKLLGLEYPPCPPLPPRAALSRILGASLLAHSPHRISPPSLPLLCGVNGERDSTDSPHSLLSPPRRLALEPHGSPPSLSLRTLVCLIASSPPSISLRVCVCVCVKRRELDLTLPALGKRTYCTAPHSHQSYVMVRGLRSARSVSSHTWPFSRQSPVSCLSLCLPCPPLSIISLSLSLNLKTWDLGSSLCVVCVECVKCVEGVCVCARKLRSRGPVPQLWYYDGKNSMHLLPTIE